jgi:hypothetical protein
MLVDHRRERVREAQDAVRLQRSVQEYGDYIAKRAKWSLFGTISFSKRLSEQSAFARVTEFLETIQRDAGSPIGWVMATDRGEIGRRLHVHILVAGVDDLQIDSWEQRACRLFGDSEFDSYDDSLAGAYYIAKNGLSPAGELYFGGPLFDRDRPGRAATKSQPPEEDAYVVFIAGRGKRRGVRSAYAWIHDFNHHCEEQINGLTQHQAVYGALISAFAHIPENTRVEILCSDRVVCRQFDGRFELRDKKMRRLLDQVREVISERRLEVTMSWVSASVNLASRSLLYDFSHWLE